ncbi:MAG: cupin domain-containing protein [Gammaproteobacteria bacterium]
MNAPDHAAALAATASMEDLYRALVPTGMGPGWNKPEPSLWPAPRANFRPVHWSYATAHAALDAAGRFVSTELAERRNLILFNPVPGNTYATVRTLIAAYQMVMPHETARSHRHTPNALRLVVDAAPGAYTVVDGRKIPMAPGDVLLTPNWAWHGHSNESDARAYWIDFLDVPTVHFLEPMFFETYHERIERTDIVDAASPFRFAFADVRKRLESAAPARPGWRSVELGPPRMDTIGLHVGRLEAGARLQAGRTTANSIYAVIEGGGTSDIDGSVFHWARGDVFAVPAWRPAVHESRAGATLLRVTDEPLMRMLHWLREEPEGGE